MPKTTTKKTDQVDEDVEVKTIKPSQYLKKVENYVLLYRSVNGNEMLKITEVWKDTFRVNIWGKNPNWINDSYFIKVRDGEIAECNPPLI